MIALPAVIGHRGAAGEAPENTLASFRRAAALGATMVEFDVRLSADGVPVVFHDDDLGRTRDGSGPVAARTLAELKRLDAGSWFGAAFAGEAIPSLDEVLTLCLELGLAVNLEIKPDAGAEVETAVGTLAVARARWPEAGRPPLVSSFAEAALAEAGRLAPDWPRGLLVDDIPADWLSRAERLGCCAVHADHARLDAAAVAAITATGRRVLAYTVNDRRRETALLEMGVSSIFSDFPHSS